MGEISVPAAGCFKCSLAVVMPLLIGAKSGGHWVASSYRSSISSTTTVDFERKAVWEGTVKGVLICNMFVFLSGL